MGMDLFVRGYKPPDKKWKEMKAVWDACRKAGIQPPDKVEKFFEYDIPSDIGVTVEIEDMDCCSPWSEEGAEGIEINMKKLPKDVSVIRAYISY